MATKTMRGLMLADGARTAPLTVAERLTRLERQHRELLELFQRVLGALEQTTLIQALTVDLLCVPTPRPPGPRRPRLVKGGQDG